jgi:hypothetical protein
VHRQPGVDHGVDEDDLAPLDLGVEVLEKPDALVAVAVPGELDEVEGMVDRRGARQVAQERDAGLQRPDEQRLMGAVVAAELLADLSYPGADLVGVEEYLADALVACRRCAQDAFARPNRTASRSKSRS